jgi:hypothetical protein
VIISHRHRYVFVELPRTGSTAVRRELRTMYEGQPILYKHATYPEFLRIATDDEKTYFAFSTIRNPLDQAVSRFFKLKTDHKGQFSDPQRIRAKRWLNRLVDRRVYQFASQPDADFATYLRRYHVLPYDTWASISHDKIDFVMRFERLAEDFEEALKRIGIEPARRLPHTNPTRARDMEYTSYFPPGSHVLARRIFGGYMERWGYTFPPEWHLGQLTASERFAYATFSRLAGLYWLYVRPRLSMAPPKYTRQSSA